MQTRHRIIVILLSCAVAGISGVAVATLLFRPKPVNENAGAGISPDAFTNLDSNLDEGGLPTLFPTPAFALVDQSGKPVTHETLRGKPWIADFIFTHCAGPCPMMTAKMAQLQRDLPGDTVKLVSFSVDPERDRPAVLKTYADRFEADASRWHFLTTPGGEVQPIYDVAAGMKLAAIGATENDPIIHSEKFLLVDATGNVRGVYSSSDEQSMSKLVADATRLAKGE